MQEKEQDLKEMLQKYLGQEKVWRHMEEQVITACRRFVNYFISTLETAFFRILHKIGEDEEHAEDLTILLQEFKVVGMAYTKLSSSHRSIEVVDNKIYFETDIDNTESKFAILRVKVDILPYFPSVVFEFPLWHPLWMVKLDTDYIGLAGMWSAVPQLVELSIGGLYIHFPLKVNINFDMSFFLENHDISKDPLSFGGWLEIQCQHIARSILNFYKIKTPQENDLSRWVIDLREVLWEKIAPFAGKHRHKFVKQKEVMLIAYDVGEAFSDLVDKVNIHPWRGGGAAGAPNFVEETFSIPLGGLHIYIQHGGVMQTKQEWGYAVIYLNLGFLYNYYEVHKLEKVHLSLSVRISPRDGSIFSISGEDAGWETVLSLEGGRILPSPWWVVRQFVQDIGGVRGLKMMFSIISDKIEEQVLQPGVER